MSQRQQGLPGMCQRTIRRIGHEISWM